jgi:hypothetical protein
VYVAAWLLIVQPTKFSHIHADAFTLRCSFCCFRSFQQFTKFYGGSALYRQEATDERQIENPAISE